MSLPFLSFQAIDVWMGLCTAFVFAALVEFTIVNFWFRKFKKRQDLIISRALPFIRTASNMTNVTTLTNSMGMAKTDGSIKSTNKVIFSFSFKFRCKLQYLDFAHLCFKV